MLRDLARQHAANARRTYFTCPYKGARVQADYPRLTRAMQALVWEFQPRPVEAPGIGIGSLSAGPSSRPGDATLKRKGGPEMDEVDQSQSRDQKHNMVSPDAAAREPEKKKRAKPVEVIDLT